MERKVLVVITTEEKNEVALKIGKFLIKRKLAACVSFKEINSIYSWKGKLEHTKETEIIIKSKPQKLEFILDILKKELTNELPQLIYKSFESEGSYYDWITKSIV